MYKLKQYIDNSVLTVDKRINEAIYIKNKVLYIKDQYKYQDEAYFVKAGDKWINLQGGVPNYTTEENLNENIFEEVING